MRSGRGQCKADVLPTVLAAWSRGGSLHIAFEAINRPAEHFASALATIGMSKKIKTSIYALDLRGADRIDVLEGNAARIPGLA